MKALKWILISLGILVLLAYGGFEYMKYNTKKLSPEGSASFNYEQYDVSMNYSRPSMRGRTIFGELVPYNTVWRTGANEATTFNTKTDLEIGGQTLPAGEYTLWTIPGELEWQFIWNNGDYGWGVNWEGQASRDPQYDVLTTNVYKENVPQMIETMTINLVQAAEGFEMQLAWESVLVRVPIK